MPGPKHNPVPLWLTLGFGIGLVFGWFAFRSPTQAPPPPAFAALKPSTPTQPSSSDSAADARTLSAIELTFLRWGGYAVWENDVAEFAAWNPLLKQHADYYEVRRTADGFYFRTIPALTRPLVDHGVQAELPFAFTEPKSVREEFYREHPDYHPATAPKLVLPPKPPEPHAEWVRKIEARGGGVPPPPVATPGDGKY